MVIVDRHLPASWFRKNYPDYKLFTITRPYDDRIKSAYGHGPKHGMTLDELVAEVKRKGVDNISLMLKPEAYFLDATPDYVIRFGFLQSDLDDMLTTLGFEPVELIQCNSFK